MATHPSQLFLLHPGQLNDGSWYLPGGTRVRGSIRAPLIAPNQVIRIPEDATVGSILGRVRVYFAPASLTLVSAPASFTLLPNGDVQLTAPLPPPESGNVFTLVLTAINAKGTSSVGSVTLRILRDPVVVPDDDDDWFAPPMSFAPGLPL